jgi:hypothetical protein
VQVIADPVGRLIWVSPPLPGARHDMGAAREHGVIDALNAAEVPALADTPTRVAAQRSASRNDRAGSAPTPADTCAVPRHRSRSTPRTPANADPASAPMSS